MSSYKRTPRNSTPKLGPVPQKVTKQAKSSPRNPQHDRYIWYSIEETPSPTLPTQPSHAQSTSIDDDIEILEEVPTIFRPIWEQLDPDCPNQ